MDHVVFVDPKAEELEKLIAGTKTAILRGATGRKMPYGRVNPGDSLYLMRNNGEGLVRAQDWCNTYSIQRRWKKENRSNSSRITSTSCNSASSN